MVLVELTVLEVALMAVETWQPAQVVMPVHIVAMYFVFKLAQVRAEKHAQMVRRLYL